MTPATRLSAVAGTSEDHSATSSKLFGVCDYKRSFEISQAESVAFTTGTCPRAGFSVGALKARFAQIVLQVEQSQGYHMCLFKQAEAKAYSMVQHTSYSVAREGLSSQHSDVRKDEEDAVFSSLHEAALNPHKVRHLDLTASPQLQCNNLLCDKVGGPCICRFSRCV